MSINRWAAKRDLNEPLIFEAIRKAGYALTPCKMPCDAIVSKSGLHHLVEVKAAPGPKGGVSHAVLTEAQSKVAAEVESVGCCFHVVRSPQEALDQLRECHRKHQPKGIPDA